MRNLDKIIEDISRHVPFTRRDLLGFGRILKSLSPSDPDAAKTMYVRAVTSSSGMSGLGSSDRTQRYIDMWEHIETRVDMDHHDLVLLWRGQQEYVRIAHVFAECLGPSPVLVRHFVGACLRGNGIFWEGSELGRWVRHHDTLSEIVVAEAIQKCVKVIGERRGWFSQEVALAEAMVGTKVAPQIKAMLRRPQPNVDDEADLQAAVSLFAEDGSSESEEETLEDDGDTDETTDEGETADD
jgi:hypothetical protein